MSLSGRLRERVPAAYQDVLRDARDIVSPQRRRAAARRRADAGGSRALAAAVAPDGRVRTGVFAGMRMPLDASWGGQAARLLGSYEVELVPALRRLIADRPPRVLDVGSAEGYYAVGLALALPDAEVYAFDIDRHMRRLCARTAQLNGVSNLHVLGRADAGRLRSLLVPGALLVSDCEGCEATLLDPSAVPALRTAHLLVELHEFAVPGVTRLVLDRFATTHAVVVIDAVPRVAAAYPELAHLDASTAQAALDEGRPIEPHPMQWAVMRPLALDH